MFYKWFSAELQGSEEHHLQNSRLNNVRALNRNLSQMEITAIVRVAMLTVSQVAEHALVSTQK